MEHRSEDRRVRRTRRQLQEALAALMREKDLKDITVRELTERADVNRGTFYSHYQDLYDLREQMEEELFRQLSQVLSACPLERTPGGLRPILTAVFQFILENQALFVTALSGGGERFFSRLLQMIQELYLRQWSGFYDLGGAQGTNYYLEFVVSGVMGLVRSWVRGGMGEPPEEMAALAEQMIVRGLPGAAAE